MLIDFLLQLLFNGLSTLTCFLTKILADPLMNCISRHELDL